MSTTQNEDRPLAPCDPAAGGCDGDHRSTECYARYRELSSNAQPRMAYTEWAIRFLSQK
jgi:hypothetical protein